LLPCCRLVQDDEVDRLERSSRPGGWRGLGRQEVMEGMYGKMDPRPAGEADHLYLFSCQTALRRPGSTCMAAKCVRGLH
jgi:hypothetical protein